MSQSIHRHTPTLAAVDARRLPVRAIAYHRALAGDIPQARVSRQAYDTAGRVAAQWDPRLWALVESDGTVPANQTSVYSLSGQVLASTSVDAGWRVNLPTESGQSLRRWDGRGSASRVEYDALLRPVAVFEQGQGQSERCVERLRYADASLEAAARNLCGQLIRHDDPAGSLIVHNVGLSGGLLQQSRHLLTQETVPDWPVDESECDALLEPGEGALTRQQYSALGESLQQTDAKGHRRRFAYSVAGQMNSTWLQLAAQDEQVLLSAIGYNAFGQVESETAGNGVVSTARYSPVDGRLEQLLAHKDDGTRLQDLTYGYDPVGNILSIRDGAQPVRHFNNQRIEPVSTYQYDTLYQLIKATGRESAAPSRGPALPGFQVTSVDPNQLANYTQNYSYDAGGNLTTLCHVGAQCYTHTMQVADHSNRSVKKDEGNPATAFDANGNLQQLQPGKNLSWDLRNQLRQVTPVERVDAANDDEVYVYDGGGQRVRKIRRTQAKNVMHRAEVRYLPGLELRTNTATGETLQVISVSAGRSGVRVLHWEAGRPDDLPNDQLRYSLSDHLGSSSLELDQQAQLISQEGYYPYGGTAWWAGRNATEASYKTIRYSGKELDATGLYYYGFRYYAPWLQRWINPDPAGDIDGLNLFRMVGNNPIGYVDAQGTNSTKTEIAMAAGASMLRDGVAAGMGAVARYYTTEALKGTPTDTTNITIETIVGALAGGLAGGVVGAGLGTKMVASSRFSDSFIVKKVGLIGGTLIGAAAGASPSVAGYFSAMASLNTDKPTHNLAAIAQIGALVNAVVREPTQRTIVGIGPNITWNGRPPLTGVAGAGAFYGLSLAGIGAAENSASLPIQSIVGGTVAEVFDALGGSVARGLHADAAFKSGTNKLTNPFSASNLKGTLFGVTTRAAGSAAVANVGLAVSKAAIDPLSLAGGVVDRLGGVITEARVLIGSHALEGLSSTTENINNDPSTMNSRMQWVASNDNAEIEMTSVEIRHRY